MKPLHQISLDAAVFHVDVDEAHDPYEWGAADGCRLCKRYRRGMWLGEIGDCGHGLGFRGDARPAGETDLVVEIIIQVLDFDGVFWGDQLHGWPGGVIGSAVSKLERWGLIIKTGQRRTSRKREANGRPAFEYVLR